MSRLHNILVQQYTSHYEKLWDSLDPRGLSPREWKTMDRRYGQFVRRLPPGRRVLDVGCGTGFLLYWLSRQPGIVPVGVDASASQVEWARKSLPGIDVACDDGLAHLRKREPGSLGAIFCTDVLEHVPEGDEMLEWVEAAHRALAPGGFFYVRMPNGANLTASYARYRDLTHMRCFTATSAEQLLQAGGFADCRAMAELPGHARGMVRHAVEKALHLAVFRVCCHKRESIFTKNICAVGYKR